MSDRAFQFTNPLLIEKADVLSLASFFRAQLGKVVIDFGAAEPLVWSSKGESIVDLVNTLRNEGFTVALTTNGAVLTNHIEALASAGLQKLRISWPSFDKQTFQDITGKPYEPFLEGVSKALHSGIDLKFNRLLLNGYTDDLPDHLDWIGSHGGTLKIYDLYWIPANSHAHGRYYQGVQEVIEAHVMPLSSRIEEVPHPARPRWRYYLGDSACVEVKGSPVRIHSVCRECPFRSACNEGFLDYLRVEPNGMLTPCYLRGDLSVDLVHSEGVLSAMCDTWRVGVEALSYSKVCLTVTSLCNQNCRFPGSDVSWCLRRAR